MPPKQEREPGRRRHHAAPFPAEDQTLTGIRASLLSGSTSGITLEVFRQYQERALAGEFIRLEPPKDSEQVILFYQYPGIDLDFELLPFVSPGTPVPTVRAGKDFHNNSQKFIRRFGFFLDLMDTYILSLDAENMRTPEDIQATHDVLIPLTERFSDNYRNAVSLLLDGYKGHMRRTGEPFQLHSMRNFISVFTDRLPHSLGQTWILNTTLLSTLFHDTDEDFKEFTFEKTYQHQNEYKLSCRAKNGRSISTNLHLTKDEAELFQMQLDALTTPEVGPEITDEEKNRIQFAHLVEVTGTIAAIPKFGPLAAFYTLLIKWKDRFDNLCTYWERDEQGKVKIDKNYQLRKLKESYLHFQLIEAKAKEYLEVWATSHVGDVSIASKYELAKREMEEYLDSVVKFSQMLLFGASYHDLLKTSTDVYGENYAQAAQINDPNKRRLSLQKLLYDYPFLIPTPQARPKRTGVSNLPIEEIIKLGGNINFLKIPPPNPITFQVK